MKISAIAAVGKNREIGLNNKLIWHISDDLKNFKNLTMDHHLVMGRKTFESIGKTLKGRKVIVLTSDPYLNVKDNYVAHSVDEAIFIAENHGETELMVCGGEKVYRDFLSHCDTLYLSNVEYEGKADTFFPEYDSKDWTTTREEFHPEKGDTPSWTYQILKRVKKD